MQVEAGWHIIWTEGDKKCAKNLLDTLFQYFYTTSIIYKSLRLKPKQKICFRLITEVCEMHLGVYNDWLQTQHNAKLRSAQVCHVNFPSTLQHTVIWAAFKMATTFFFAARPSITSLWCPENISIGLWWPVWALWSFSLLRPPLFKIRHPVLPRGWP